MSSATTEVEVVEIRRNAGEVIRVRPTEYSSVDLLDVRVYYEDPLGEKRPTRKGLSLRPAIWRELLPLIQQALPEPPEASDEENSETL